MDKDNKVLEMLGAKADEQIKAADAKMKNRMENSRRGKSGTDKKPEETSKKNGDPNPNKKNAGKEKPKEDHPETDKPKEKMSSGKMPPKKTQEPEPVSEEKTPPSPAKKMDKYSDDFKEYAEAMRRQSNALSPSSEDTAISRNNRIKSIKGKELGEEVTKDHAENVLSNKELGGRRKTVIVRTRVVDTKGNEVEEFPEKKAKEEKKEAPEKAHAPADKATAPKLLLIREDTGEAYEIDRDLTIGREEDNDIVIPNPEGHYVSAHHAQIKIQGKDIYLKDLGSTNGTYINDRKVGSWRLKAGIKVEFGDIVFKVESV